MPTSTPGRGIRYYMDRMKREAPQIYADYLAGKYPSQTAAAKAAGLMMTRTPLHEMKNAWRKASPAEQKEMLIFLGVGSVYDGPVANADLYLLPQAKGRIQDIMDRRRIKWGDVMRELGEKSLDPSISMAMEHKRRIKLDLIKKLQVWLKANAAI